VADVEHVLDGRGHRRRCGSPLVRRRAAARSADDDDGMARLSAGGSRGCGV
jgi:hypothetical protein